MHDYIISQLAADRRRVLRSEAEDHRIARAAAKVRASSEGRTGWLRRHWSARAVAHH